MEKLVVASGNKGKISEIKSILGGFYDVVSMQELGFNEDIEENFGYLKDFYEYNKAVVPELAAEYLERIGCSEAEYLALIAKLTPPCEISMSESLITESHSRWIGNGSIAKCQGEFTANMADEILRRKFAESC